ncbi:hypothetical protein CHARACLAT_027052 [Characodon lateralis]|uniref:Uncharacterized protein n=1 Tax=Characodon lateralis TaxID=208331 RepID=A0ABU7D139_9TELE|nr:hypothetical protein [Characodon lateralis]
MASDLEELIFIPAASHSAANRPSVCFWSWLEGASRTTSSAKRRDEIHWSPNQTPLAASRNPVHKSYGKDAQVFVHCAAFNLGQDLLVKEINNLNGFLSWNNNS